jgi:hypothetical protein
MLDNTEIKKIEDFVYAKPRAIQEIAQHIEKNWRTADRYVSEIEKNFGTITTRVFREGTRGALKIVYWASVDKISHSIFQEKLEVEILRAKRKEDFSAFDIFQHIADKDKEATIEKATNEETTSIEKLAELMSKTEKQLLIFSGNLSFTNIKSKKTDMMQVLDRLIKKGVTIKILCRVDLVGKENIEKILSLNFKNGKQLIEVRHSEQPIRAFIIDGKMFRMKEIKEPTGRLNELDKKIFIFYTIKDKDWAGWLSRIFWKIFSQSIEAEKRLNELKKIK